MEDLTSKTVAVFSRPFTVPSFAETLPAGEYEIETELVSPPRSTESRSLESLRPGEASSPDFASGALRGL